MKRKLACVLGVLLVVTGCGSGDAEEPAAVAPSASETPASSEATPSPGPESESVPGPRPMSLEEAGAYYLQHICPANEGADRYNDVLFAAVDTLNAGGTPDLAPLTKVAAESRDTNRDVADAFSDEEVLWPSVVQEDIQTLVDFQYEEMAFLSNMAQARDVEQYFLIVDAYEQMTVESDGPAAAQKIRAKLDLSADAVKSCENYTG
jgi:hypothetical protein